LVLHAGTRGGKIAKNVAVVPTPLKIQRDVQIQRTENRRKKNSTNSRTSEIDATTFKPSLKLRP
jgi:hypothetical protein